MRKSCEKKKGGRASYALPSLSLYGGILSILLSVFVAGCGDGEWRNKKPGVYVEDRRVLIYNLKPSDVIIRLNGHSIRKRDFDAMQAMYGAIVRMQWKLPFGTVSERVDRFVKNREQKTPEELLRRELFWQEAERLKVEIPQEDRSNAFVRIRRRLNRPKAVDVKEIAEEIGGDAGSMFLHCFESDLKDEVVRRLSTTNWQYEVTDADIAKRMKEVEDFNARASLSNELQRAKANAVKARALAGEDMASLSRECSQVHPEFGENWTSVQVGEIAQDEDLRKWLDQDPAVGEISNPIDLDDGLAIIKVVDKKHVSPGNGFDDYDEYTLTRVTFFAYEYFPEENHEKTRATLVMERRQKAQEEIFKRLYNAAVIEFPNGMSFFEPRGAKKPPMSQ